MEVGGRGQLAALRLGWHGEGVLECLAALHGGGRAEPFFGRGGGGHSLARAALLPEQL